MWPGAFVSFVLAAGLTPVLAQWARRHGYLDVPNPRSSHSVATPRIGGLALVIALLAGLTLVHVGMDGLSNRVIAIVGAALGIAALGLIDDFRSVPALVRLSVQVVVASALVIMLGPLPFAWIDARVAGVLTVLWLVTLTNAYNFMDGIDGIAGTQAFVGGIGWFMLGLVTATVDLSALGLLVAVASAAFLLHNWQPARVFMGDAGSGFLGFLFAALPLVAPDGHADLALCGALLAWPFLFDTGFTLLRRLRRRENILTAHRSHLYQRLTITGLMHSQVTLLYGALAAIGVAASLAVTAGGPAAVWAAFAALVLAAVGLWRLVVLREEREPRSPR